MLSWLEAELGVVGDSSSFSSLSTGISGMARGSSSPRGPSRLGLFRLPTDRETKTNVDVGFYFEGPADGLMRFLM